jgi:hypothetical protein
MAEQRSVTTPKCETVMRLYLDNCAFNRPFDDQGHIRVRLEAEAKLYIQERIQEGKAELAWSYILRMTKIHLKKKEAR